RTRSDLWGRCGTVPRVADDASVKRRRRRSPGRRPEARGLLELDLGAGAFELLLGLVGVLLGDVLEDGFRGRLDELLRLLEPEAPQAADLLDDLDLLVPGLGEDDVELVLHLRAPPTPLAPPPPPPPAPP